MRDLHIFTTGGTIDKVYFDALSEFQVGESPLDAILREANVTLEYELTSLMKKDSLELTEDDRDLICTAIEASPAAHILVTHGTDTMARTAARLMTIKNKTIVLTGVDAAGAPALYRRYLQCRFRHRRRAIASSWRLYRDEWSRV